jgi:protein SCO1
MAEGNSKFISRSSALIIVIALPIILYIFFMLLTKEAKEDLRKVEYPHKIKPIGFDTIEVKGNKVVETIYYTIPDFSFTNQYGQTITQNDLKGRIFVADFFFTHCPSICPKMSASLKSLQDEFIRDDKFLILSHTIDPKRDSVQRLKEYASSYEAVPGKWHFLTGNQEDLYEQAKAFLLAVSDEGEEDHDFTHTERFVLVDPEMNIRGYYMGTDQKSINQLKGDIVLLLEEYKRK